jgi:hypothetical protein
VVDELRGVRPPGVLDRAEEDGLPTVAVAGPLIKNKASRESFDKIVDLAEQSIGKEIYH